MADKNPKPREVKKDDRRIEKAVKRHGPSDDAFMDAVRGKRGRK